MEKTIDVNDMVNGLLECIANQAKEVALLKVQLALLSKTEDAGEEEEAE